MIAATTYSLGADATLLIAGAVLYKSATFLYKCLYRKLRQPSNEPSQAVQTSPVSQSVVSLDAEVRLKINEAVDEQLEKQISRHEKVYLAFIGFFGAVVAVYCVTFWHAQINEVPAIVEKQLADQSVIAEKNQISAAVTYALNASNIVSGITEMYDHNAMAMNQSLLSKLSSNEKKIDSEMTNASRLAARIEELKANDNIATLNDLNGLHVIDSITNLTDGNKIRLSFEPVPDSIEVIADNLQNRVTISIFGQVNGRSIILNDLGIANIVPLTKSHLKIGYFRKVTR